jgi:hypothetical protein
MIIAFKTVGKRPIVLRGKSRKAVQDIINNIDEYSIDKVNSMFKDKDELIIDVVGEGETYNFSPGLSVCNTESLMDLIKNGDWKRSPRYTQQKPN